MSRRAEAFTMVELLTAVAVVAGLAALVASAAGQVHERGMAAQCMSNLRQLAAANLAYAADHDGQYVAAEDITNRVRWHGVRGSSAEKFDPTRGPLAPYLGAEGRVKLCPALQNVLTGASSFEDGSGGYGYNASYIGGTPLNFYQAERMSRVERPARTVMFTDAAFPRAGGLQEYPFCEPWTSEYPLGNFQDTLSASVHFRHLGNANVAWCDGHVTAEPPSAIDSTNGYGGDAAKYRIGWFGPQAQNGYWRPY